MLVEMRRWSATDGWQKVRSPNTAMRSAQLVLVFGGIEALSGDAAGAELRARYPAATILGCSTAGEICGTEVTDDTIVATAVQFEHTSLRLARERLPAAEQSFAVGQRLAAALPAEGLAHAFVLAGGVRINGSELAAGLSCGLPAHVAATGGLAGDGGRFARTLVWVGDEAREDIVGVVGLYGDRLRVGYGSMGGWDPFGPERLITRAEGNVLYELDGEPALALYQRYLGDQAAELPASGLRFPLSLRNGDPEHRLVRTILGIDEAAGSLIFAGDIPQGHHARLMKANVDRLIDGATGAATSSYPAVGSQVPDLAVLISCVGRRLVLAQRVEEEVESVRRVLGNGAALCGFYSYGEIAPFSPSVKCELHNQTMTITTFSER
jgi:hypothetical protein